MAKTEKPISIEQPSASHFKIAMRGAPITLWSQDTDLRYTWIFSPALDGDPNQALGKNDREIMQFAEEAEQLTALKEAVLQSGQEYQGEFAFHMNDKWRIYDMLIQPLRNEAGNIIGLSGMALDVTERKAVEEAERQQRVLIESLYDTALVMISTLDLNEVLDRILANVRRVVPHDAGDVMLIDDNMAHIVRSHGYAERGLENAILALRFPINTTPTLNKMMQSGESQVIGDMRSYDGWLKLPQEDWLRSYAGVPIILQDQIIGFLNLVSAKPDYFTKGHLECLEALTAQAAVAIHNAQVHERAKEVATTEERHRLARELHDSVNQMLFSSSMIAEALPKLDPQVDDEVLDYLRRLRRLNRGALAEMRLLLLEMRPAYLVEVDLPTQLRRLVDAVHGREDIEVELEIDDGHEAPPDVRLVLYRIAQEALNNISKHAHAPEASVYYQSTPEKATLVIQDEGRGFDTQSKDGNMGIRSMFERAATINAEINMQSKLGQGTRIQVTWYGELES